MQAKYSWKMVEIMSLLILVVGGLNWGLVGAFKFDLVKWIGSALRLKWFAAFVYVLVGLSALVHVFSRDYYLRFLGETVFPCGSLKEKTPMDANVRAKVYVEPGVNVVFWGAEPNLQIVDNPWQAYSEYANAGVTKADNTGVALLAVRKPASYKVPSGRTLKSHIHYRTCDGKGMLGPVKTVFV